MNLNRKLKYIREINLLKGIYARDLEELLPELKARAPEYVDIRTKIQIFSISMRKNNQQKS